MQSDQRSRKPNKHKVSVVVSNYVRDLMNFKYVSLSSPHTKLQIHVAVLKQHADNQTEWWEAVQRF